LDREQPAGDRVDGEAVGRAVVGDQPFDGDAVGLIGGEGPPQEAHCGRGLLVGEEFDMGQAGGVIDGDVHELPALVIAAPMMSAGGLATPGRGDRGKRSGRAF
jgi:hypothetical protein